MITLGNGASGEEVLAAEDALNAAHTETQNTSEKSEKPEAAPEKVNIYEDVIQAMENGRGS